MRSLICFLLLFIFVACSDDKKEFFYKKAYVTNISYRHWGRGNFKIQLHYRFEYKGDTINACSELKKMSMWNSSIYNVSDTVLILVNKDDLQQTRFVRRLFNSKDRIFY